MKRMITILIGFLLSIVLFILPILMYDALTIPNYIYRVLAESCMFVGYYLFLLLFGAYAKHN